MKKYSLIFNFFRKVIFGARLDNSIRTLIGEISNSSVNQSTVGDVVTFVVYRLTRIGVFLIIISLIPLSLLFIQTNLLSKQNEKLDIQNTRLREQTYLQEASRRSNQLIIFNDLLDDIGSELIDKDSFSSAIESRIISLAKSFKPYVYLDGNNLVDQPVSPERGQLFLFLNHLNLDPDYKSRLLGKIDLSFMELTHTKIDSLTIVNGYMDKAKINNLDLNACYLVSVSISNSDLSDWSVRDSYLRGTFINSKFDELNIRNSTIVMGDFRGAQVHNSYFVNVYIAGCFFAPVKGMGTMISMNTSVNPSMDSIISIQKPASFYRSTFRGVTFKDCVFFGVDFRRSSFDNCDFRDSEFYGALLDTVLLEGVIVDNQYWLDSLNRGEQPATWLWKHHEVVKEFVEAQNDSLWVVHFTGGEWSSY